MLLIIGIVIFIYFGIGTPTEAAAIGALGALIIGLIMKRLNTKKIINALMETIKQTGMIFLIIMGAKVFSYYLTMTRIGNQIINAIASSDLSSYNVLFLIILIYLILGMFMETIGMLLLTLPLVFL